METKFKYRFKQLFLMLALVGVVITTSCGDDDDDAPTAQTQQDIVALAVDNGYDILAAALTRADLVAALQGPGPFTVFAPTDAAFEAAGITEADLADIPTAELSAILQYHVVSGRILSSDLTTGAVATVEGTEVNIDATALTVNGIDIIDPFDVEGSNGVIHTINGVLTLPEVEEPAPTESIVELAEGNSDLTLLVTALTKFPDLVETLDGEGSYTVFAPTNAAFEALLGVVGQNELNDIPESVLRRVLEYHVVAGTAALSNTLTDGQTIGTVLSMEDQVTVGINGETVTINGATVTTADVAATNGVVHVVDAVLVPELELSIVNTVAAPAYFNVNYTTLVAALQEADLIGALTDPQESYTVFAPTNAAFDALLAELQITAADLLADEGLSDILLYHVLDGAVTSENLTTGYVNTLEGSSLSIDATEVTVNGIDVIAPFDVSTGNGVVHTIGGVLEVPTVADIIDSEFSILATALGQEQLLALFEGTEDYTVFAPTDAAFESLASASQVTVADLLALPNLTDILTYHVLPGTITSGDLTTGLFETAQGVQVAIDAGALTVNDAGIILPLADLSGSNGVVHGIDEVLLIPTLDEVATANNFSILVEAVVAAGLVDAITADDADLTIFAPTNAAFEALLTDLQITKADLLARQDLADILLYHIVDGVVTSDMLSDSTVPTLLDGQSLTVSATNLTINTANLEAELIDVLAANGIIHGIDEVLLPPAN